MTIVTVGATAVMTMLARGPWPALQPALERNLGALTSGEWWRVLSPVLMQTDSQVWQVVGTWGLAAAIGAFTERHFGHWRAAVAFVVGGLAGNAAGYAFGLPGGGISVAAFGQLGALAPWFVRAGPRPARIVGAVIIVAALADAVWWRDHHGVAVLGGALVGLGITGRLPPVDADR